MLLYAASAVSGMRFQSMWMSTETVFRGPAGPASLLPIERSVRPGSDPFRHRCPANDVDLDPFSGECHAPNHFRYRGSCFAHSYSGCSCPRRQPNPRCCRQQTYREGSGSAEQASNSAAADLLWSYRFRREEARNNSCIAEGLGNGRSRLKTRREGPCGACRQGRICSGSTRDDLPSGSVPTTHAEVVALLADAE
jgi:hypothetical protein